MINSLRITLVTLTGVTLGGWASAQTATPGTAAEPFIYPSKGQTAADMRSRSRSPRIGIDRKSHLRECNAGAQAYR